VLKLVDGLVDADVRLFVAALPIGPLLREMVRRCPVVIRAHGNQCCSGTLLAAPALVPGLDPRPDWRHVGLASGTPHLLHCAIVTGAPEVAASSSANAPLTSSTSCAPGA
jgi:hypothetical protein